MEKRTKEMLQGESKSGKEQIISLWQNQGKQEIYKIGKL